MTLIKLLATALAFTRRAFAAAPPGYRRRQQAKIIFQVLCRPRFARSWFQLLQRPEFVALCALRPRLYFKPFRVYQSTRWTPAQRRAALLDCYDFINSWPLLQASLRGPQLLLILPATAPLPPVSLELGYDERYRKEGEVASATAQDSGSLPAVRLELGYDERYRKEGELVLSLMVEGAPLAAAAFSFGREGERWLLRIGCIQGSRNRTEIAKALQKSWHGLRPAALLVHCPGELALAYGCRELQGVSAAIQAHRAKHFIHLHCHHRIHFDYDRFWQEQEGVLGADGWFSLPLPRPPRDLSTVKSQKRSLHRQRQRLLAELSAQLQQRLGAS